MNLRLRRRIYERIRDMTTSMKVTGGRWSVRKLLLIYTLVFCLFFSAAFFMFARAQHTFIWNVDGGPQYVPYLAYIGMYLGLSIGINIINALLIGILGIPGLLLLVFLTMIG